MPETNGNGYVKKLHFYVALAGFTMVIGGLVFNAGASRAGTDLRLERAERDITMLEDGYARKDVVDQRLLNLEQAETRIEKSEADQADMLNRILLGQKRLY